MTTQLEKAMKFQHVGKWLKNGQIDYKFSNSLWNNKWISNAQTTQVLEFKYT